MPLKYACTFVLKKSRQLKVNKYRNNIQRHRALVNMTLYKCCILLLFFIIGQVESFMQMH